MNTDRDILIRKTVLKILDECEGHLIREPILLTQVQLAVDPTPIQREFDDAILFLDSHKFITGIRSAMGGPVKWKITDLGRTEL